jgi:putative spermidine/putrescine transport system permease protein
MATMTRSTNWLGTLPLSAFFVVFYVVPIALLLLVSVDPGGRIGGFDVANYRSVLGDSFSLGVLADTLRLGAEATVVAAVFALPLAVLYRNAGRSMRAVLMVAILLPLLTSTVVRTFAWIVILGREGVINSVLATLGLVDEPPALLYTRGGLVLALAQIYLPLMALPIINSLLRIDERLLQASEGLGASSWRTFWQVIMPLTAPGLLAGALLTFAGTSTAFITQTLVGGGRHIFMPLLIYQQAVALQKWGNAATLSVVFVVAVLLIMAASNRLARARMRGVDA